MLVPSPAFFARFARWLKVLAIVIIILGLSMTTQSIFGGLIETLLGVGLLHYCCKTKQKAACETCKKVYQRPWVYVVAALYLLMCVSHFAPASITKITVEGLWPTQLNVTQAEQVKFSYEPANASVDAVELSVSHPETMSAKLLSAENGVIICEISPLKPGQASVFCQSDSIRSKDMTFEISDPEAEAKAEQERLAAEQKAAEEEAARRAAEEEAARKAEEEEAARKAAEEEAARKATEQAAAQQPSQSKLVGSITSDKYHTPSCRWAKKIKPENEIWFSSAEDAKNNGYKPCSTCH